MMFPFAWKKWLVRSGLARYTPAARRLTAGHPDAVGYYSDRVLAAPIHALTDPATFPELPGPDVMHLNLAAPRFESPVSAGRLAFDRLGTPPAWGLPALRSAIAERYPGIDRDEVLITHGATGAYAAALDAFVNPGDRVVLFDPGSPLFSLGAVSRRANIRWVTTPADGDYRFDPDALSRALRGAKLLALSDPMNPTGGMLSADECEKIAWAVDRSDVLVYLDESFSRFRYDGSTCPLASRPGMAQRLLRAGSVTQGCGLGSARVGWLVGPQPLVGACALTASLTAPFVPTVCQQAALRAVTADDELYGPIVEEFRARRKYVIGKLTALGFTVAPPAGGCFVWVNVAHLGYDGRTFAAKLLAEHRVLVGPGDVYGPSGKNFVRVSFAEEDGRLREGLARLAAFVGQVKNEPAALAEPSAMEVDERLPTFSRV